MVLRLLSPNLFRVVIGPRHFKGLPDWKRRLSLFLITITDHCFAVRRTTPRLHEVRRERLHLSLRSYRR
jgi:hypothetical protein